MPVTAALKICRGRNASGLVRAPSASLTQEEPDVEDGVSCERPGRRTFCFRVSRVGRGTGRAARAWKILDGDSSTIGADDDEYRRDYSYGWDGMA